MNSGSISTAKNNIQADWHHLRDSLVVGTPNGWKNAFIKFYETRLNLRYLQPIKVLQETGLCHGEGFSIMAIQCSLIEFLESTEQGINYRYSQRGANLGEYEYCSSKPIFTSFLSTRPPFSRIFNEASASSFYEGVRCGLLHEAQTKGGWRILARNPDKIIADTTNLVVYRDHFQEALLTYVKDYGQRLENSSKTQEAFIRKFNALCL